MMQAVWTWLQTTAASVWKDTLDIAVNLVCQLLCHSLCRLRKLHELSSQGLILGALIPQGIDTSGIDPTGHCSHGALIPKRFHHRVPDLRMKLPGMNRSNLSIYLSELTSVSLL